MDPRGQVWQITRVENQCAYARIPCPVAADRPGEQGFTQHQVRQWPVVQIQPVPEAPAEAPPNDLQWEFDEKMNILSMLIPAAPKPIRVPFARLDMQILGTFREDYLRLFVRSLNHGLSKLDHAPRPKARPDVRWSYNRNTQILLAEVEDDESIETIRCFLRIAQADDLSTKAINLVLHQLNAQVLS